LEGYGNYDPSRVKAGCGLRFEWASDSRVMDRGRSYRILVVLGGIRPRAVELVDLVHITLKEKSEYTVIIRPHPALPWENLKAYLMCDIDAYGNFRVSKSASVKMDLETADIVIYDASSIAIEALRRGIPVIHIELKDLLSFDPLVGFNGFKWTVRSGKDLDRAIRSIYGLGDDEYVTGQIKAGEYADDYAYEITDARLDEFVMI